MPKIWSVFVFMKPTKENPRRTELFLVAAGDRAEAIRTLHIWRKFPSAYEVQADEADDREVAHWGATDLEAGYIYPVAAWSP